MTNLYTTAQIFALVGMHLLMFQLISGSRWWWLDRLIGFDKLTRLHKWTGITGLSCILVHATLLMLYYDSFGWDVLLAFITPGWRWETLGMVSLDLMVVIVVLTIFYRRVHLPYHWWKRIHQYIYLGVLGGFIHSLFLGTHLVSGWLRWYWFGLGTVGLLSFLHRRFIKKYPYQVSAHQTLAGTVHHVSLQPTSPHSLVWRPGQFAFLQVHTPGITREWHPFTISSAPGDSGVTFSIKESGDWTRTLTQLQPGTKVKLEGPYGGFSYTRLPNNSQGYVFIAGGIGITPLRSMIRQLLLHEHSQRPITLLYNARAMADLAFKAEFDQLAQVHTNFKLVYITSQEKVSAQESVRFGRVDTACLQEEITQLTDRHYFICGPKPMMRAVRQSLRSLAVPIQAVHFEEFALN